MVADASPARTVLITPSSRLFGLLCSDRAIEGRRGWLDCRRYGDCVVALAPQSLAVMDIVAAQEPGSRLVFIGLCGGLADVAVGDVVAVSTSQALDGRCYPSSCAVPGLRSVTNIQVPSLLYGASGHDWLAGQAATVDLETGAVLAQASASGVDAAAVLVVSDLNRAPGVFAGNLDDIAPSLRVACEAAWACAEGSRS